MVHIGAQVINAVRIRHVLRAQCVMCGPGADVKDRVSDIDFLSASMALRRAPIFSRLTSAGGTSASFPAPAYGLLAAGEKSIYSLYSNLLRLQPAAIGLNPAAVAAAAAMIRPPPMTVFPTVAAQPPTTPGYASTSKTADVASGSLCAGETKPPSTGGGVVSSNTLLNGGHRYRPYMSPSSLATVTKRLDTSTVRQSN